MILKYTSNENTRIDKYLGNLNLEELYSRSMIEKLILNKNILVNGKSIKKNYLLQSGDEIKIELPDVTPKEILPEEISFEVLYEDEFLAVINKPAGVVVHPGAGNYSGTLVNGLVYHFNKLSNYGGADRAGIVHRLDKDTSGVMVIAKDNKTHSLLSRMFQERKIDKFYQAIVVGIPDPAEGTIETHLRRSRKDPTKIVVSDDGKLAITHYKIIEYFYNFTLLELKIDTGRTHQIRVHMSYLNHPILGESTYSDQKRILQFLPVNEHRKVKSLLANRLKRQALHAWRISFIHPITQELIDVKSSYPNDIKFTLEWLRKNFKFEGIL